MTIFDIEDILEYDNDIYIVYRQNVIVLINDIKVDKSKDAYNDLIDFYEL
jgi:hypothetical protein